MLAFFFSALWQVKPREKVIGCNVSALTHEWFHESRGNVVIKPLGGRT